MMKKMLLSFCAVPFVHKNEIGACCVRRKEVTIEKSRIDFDVLTDDSFCARKK